VNTAPQTTLHYKNSHFATQLPVDYLYSPSHCWIARETGNIWRVGFTKFATRMLGEIVDHGFELEAGSPVTPGKAIGWIEGFKAMSDIFCIADGKFLGGNPLLKEKIELVNKLPYGEGWLYKIEGNPDTFCGDAQSYVKLLDQTIQRMLEQQKSES
jgi:glycine cleavage system H protein